MQKSSYFLILFFNFLCNASDNAFNFYQKQNFEAAIALYAQKEDKSSADWYMMGNASFYKERYCEAIVFWHQSALQSPLFYEKNACKNINQARVKLHYDALQNDALQKLPLLYPFQINEWGSFFMWFILFVLVGGIFWAFLFLFTFYYRFGMSFIRRCFFGTIVAVGFAMHQKISSIHGGYSGIVGSKSPVFVRVGPSYEYHTTEQIMPGDLVIVVAQKSDWYKIYYRNAFGWVASENLLTAHFAAQSFALPSPLE